MKNLASLAVFKSIRILASGLLVLGHPV